MYVINKLLKYYRSIGDDNYIKPYCNWKDSKMFVLYEYNFNHLTDSGLFKNILYPQGYISKLKYNTYEEAQLECLKIIIKLNQLK